jgi:DNA-binding protein YbaB
VRAAIADALTKSKRLAAEKLGGLTGGLKLPGM